MAREDAYYMNMSATQLSDYAAAGAQAAFNEAKDHPSALWNAAITAYNAAISNPTWQNVKDADLKADAARAYVPAPGTSPSATTPSKAPSKAPDHSLYALGNPAPPSTWTVKKVLMTGAIGIGVVAVGGYAAKRWAWPLLRRVWHHAS